MKPPLTPAQMKRLVLGAVAEATDIAPVREFELTSLKDRAASMGSLIARSHAIDAFRLYALALSLCGSTDAPPPAPSRLSFD